MRHNLKMISITPENYKILKKLGGAGDSFNDVITDILKRIGALKLEV
jgi:predicted CopG family antitoxin